jgi:hypothetical protein
MTHARGCFTLGLVVTGMLTVAFGWLVLGSQAADHQAVNNVLSGATMLLTGGGGDPVMQWIAWTVYAGLAILAIFFWRMWRRSGALTHR